MASGSKKTRPGLDSDSDSDVVEQFTRKALRIHGQGKYTYERCVLMGDRKFHVEEIGTGVYEVVETPEAAPSTGGGGDKYNITASVVGAVGPGARAKFSLKNVGNIGHVGDVFTAVQQGSGQMNVGFGMPQISVKTGKVTNSVVMGMSSSSATAVGRSVVVGADGSIQELGPTCYVGGVVVTVDGDDLLINRIRHVKSTWQGKEVYLPENYPPAPAENFPVEYTTHIHRFTDDTEIVEISMSGNAQLVYDVPATQALSIVTSMTSSVIMESCKFYKLVLVCSGSSRVDFPEASTARKLDVNTSGDAEVAGECIATAELETRAADRSRITVSRRPSARVGSKVATQKATIHVNVHDEKD